MAPMYHVSRSTRLFKYWTEPCSYMIFPHKSARVLLFDMRSMEVKANGTFLLVGNAIQLNTYLMNFAVIPILPWGYCARDIATSQLKTYISKALPGKLLKQYPEQSIFYATFGTATLVMAAYKLYNYGTEGAKPWYRGYYDVVRPNDPVALNWRKPEEYPAPYLSSGIETAN